MINLKKKIVAYSPSDLRKMPFRPTKSSHPTYGKCPSDLQILPIRPTKRVVGQTCPSDSFIVGRMHQYAVFKVPIRPTVHRTYSSCKNHMLVGRMGSRTDGRRSKNTPSYNIWWFSLFKTKLSRKTAENGQTLFIFNSTEYIYIYRNVFRNLYFAVRNEDYV